jgi:hypothetical protein
VRVRNLFGTTVLAIQAADKEHAVTAVRALRAMHARYTQSEHRAATPE